jgi:DNA-binding CsgD family transcriptional regulator
MYFPDLQRAPPNSHLVEQSDDPDQMRRACKQTFGLTGREAEIACWMAQGKTNFEIAVILAIARRTVEKHVEHVLAKLGVENRVAAAVRIHDGLGAPVDSGPVVKQVDGTVVAVSRPRAIRETRDRWFPSGLGA